MNYLGILNHSDKLKLKDLEGKIVLTEYLGELKDFYDD